MLKPYKSSFTDLYNIEFNKQTKAFPLKFKDNKSGRNLLERGLASEGCKDAIDKLIAEIGKSVNLRNKSILELYDDISSQKILGIRLSTNSTEYNNELNTVIRQKTTTVFGSGLAWRSGNTRLYVNDQVITGDYALVGISPRFARGENLNSSHVQKQITGESYEAFGTLVHELIHVMAVSGTVSHFSMDQAAANLDKDVANGNPVTEKTAGSFLDYYIRKNCIPEMFRAGRPISASPL